MERGHRRLQPRDIDSSRNRAASLTLVTASSRDVETQVVVVLVEVHKVGVSKVVWLGSRALDERRRHRSGHSKVVVGAGAVVAVTIVRQPVLERLQRHKLGQLDAQNLGMTSQMMNHDLACLLLLGEIAALVETARVGRIHIEHGWVVQFHHDSTRSRRGAIGTRVGVSRLQGDVLDVGERVFDLIASRVVVDIVSHASFVGGVENHQIHGILPDAPPATDG